MLKTIKQIYNGTDFTSSIKGLTKNPLLIFDFEKMDDFGPKEKKTTKYLPYFGETLN